jgi:hypothetical protein
LYLCHFGVLAGIHLFSQVEGEKALSPFTGKFGPLIRHSCFHHAQMVKRGPTLNNAVVVLDNGCIAEFGDGYAQLS